MKKIPTIFQRDWNGNKTLVTSQINPEAQWVFEGEGRATRKFDGTACLIQNGILYKRYDAKVLPQPKFHHEEKVVKQKPPKALPEGFLPAQEPDYETGHYPGWIPVGDGPEDQYHREALQLFAEHFENWQALDQSCELVGPKVQGNAEGGSCHVLIAHGKEILAAPRDFDGLKAYLQANPMEGVVWHHPDGRMAKIKARDFGIAWPRPDKDAKGENHAAA